MSIVEREIAELEGRDSRRRRADEIVDYIMGGEWLFVLLLSPLWIAIGIFWAVDTFLRWVVREVLNGRVQRVR